MRNKRYFEVELEQENGSLHLTIVSSIREAKKLARTKSFRSVAKFTELTENWYIVARYTFVRGKWVKS